ncbi:MAG: hypothetical protein H0T47_01380 [Planctomycetaceae bacterium]|nr:hypothetical protein [Planctomycetaceae bacterium]
MRGLRNGFRPRGIWSLLIAFWMLAGPFAASTAFAEPPYLTFLEGLRARRYDDIALYYLDQLAADPKVPQDVKDVLDYERAVTLIGMAGGRVDPATQAKRLDEATAALEKFIAARPDHPLVARAQSERGEILLGQARVAILQADSPGNEGKAEDFRNEARQAVAKARTIFEQARQRYEEQWKAFGPFVDADEPQKREARNASLNSLIQSRMRLAECTYREAQTYKVGDPKRIPLLTAAAKHYEEIHADYRSQTGGLYARLWMAKCFEEQAPRPAEGAELLDEARKDARQKLNIAEAIYSELLEHDTRGKPSAAQMQDYAFWFKLIVRNHPALADHRLVVDQATEWLKTRTGAAAQAPIALGVRWERAQALEKLANRRDTPEAERVRQLRSTLADAEFVNAFPGDYRDVSRAMISRIKASLGRGEKEPQDFDEANGLAQTLHNQIGEKQEALKAAKTPEEKAAAQQALTAHLDETARVLRLTLALAGPGTDRAALNGARYRLAYVEYSRNQPYDAAVLGEYLSRKFKDESPQIALDAAFVSMAAYAKLFNAVPQGQSRDFEMAKLREAAEFIGASFPDSEQANEARMMVGRLHLKELDYNQAAEWFSKVPESSPQGMEARLLAGVTFWEAYAKTISLPEAERPAQEEVDALATNAEKFLREGLALADKKLPAEAVPPEDVVAGKVTLAQIVNLDGKYQEAIDLLTAGAQPVTKLVAVADQKKRPKTGITSAAFASGVHQQLLRAYIGLQQVDQAVAEMRALEQIGGEGNTAVFVQLGRQIKAELEGLPAGGQRDAVMAAFDQFLGNLSRMQQGQTYSSLVWIGETYFGLAEAAAEPKRSTYFDRAAASYDSILKRANEAGFLPNADAANGVKLRLAAVESSRGNFARAYDLAKQVLKSAPTALNAQVEAASILKNWGTSGDADAPKQLLKSIRGDSSDAAGPVWGWGQIAQRLQRALDLGQSNQSNEDYKELYRRARYEIPAARRAYANQMSGRKQFDAEIGKAEKELLTYVATTPKDEIGDEWWSKLNTLYGDIQRDQGVASIKPLEPAKEYAPAPVARATNIATAGTANGTSPNATTIAPETKGSIAPILFGVFLAVGVTAGLVFMTMKGGKKPHRPTYANAAGGTAGTAVGPLDLSAFPAVETGGTKPAAALRKTTTRPPAKSPPLADKPRPPSTEKPRSQTPRPAPSEQPLVAKNVRRTKPSE